MILIRGIMGVMAHCAIPGDWRMQQSLSGGGLLILMALQAQRESRSRGQVYAGDVSPDTHFMAGKTAALDRRMNRFSFSLVLVAFEALCRVDILGERSRMLGRKEVCSTTNGEQDGNRQISD